MLTIIIPTRNAAATLPMTLKSIGPDADVWIVDGGSTDQTTTLAEHENFRVLLSDPGRGRQLALGAYHGMRDWCLFLHADTILPPNWSDLVAQFMQGPQNSMRAAYFGLAFDDGSLSARRVVALANWRADTFGLPYGDQGLLIHKDLYDAVGGYRTDQNLMEDVDLVRRIGPMRLKRLHGAVTTSAAKYRTDGWWARPLKNVVGLTLYLIGAPKSWYEGLYG